MNLRQLKYFVVVANERSFTKAADILHIAQPPLSRQIQMLEAELGGELLDRGERPLKLTASGRLFYEQATRMLERMDDLQKMMARASAAEKRVFIIGFVASTIYARLPPLIREFRKSTPEVDLRLIEMSTLDQIAALKEGRIDVGFGRIRFDDPAVRRTILREETLMVALPLEHRLAGDTAAISLQELASERLIVYPRIPRPSYADQVLSLFHDHGIEPHIAHEASELQTAIGLVAAEEGISIVPQSVQRSRADDVWYRPLVERATSPIIMSYRMNDHSPELVIMAEVVARMYADWGYPVPEGLSALKTT